jgi:hypothetical protein
MTTECPNNCNGTGKPCPNCKPSSSEAELARLDVALQDGWQRILIEHGLYKEAVDSLRENLDYRIKSLLDAQKRIGHTIGFIRLITSYVEDGRDFWVIHRELESIQYSLGFHTQELRNQLTRLGGIKTKVDAHFIKPPIKQESDPYLQWAFRLIQHGVELMPLSQLSQWNGVRGWLENYGVRGWVETDDDSPLEETEETEETNAQTST